MLCNIWCRLVRLLKSISSTNTSSAMKYLFSKTRTAVLFAFNSDIFSVAFLKMDICTKLLNLKQK